MTVLCGRLHGSPLCVHLVFTVETNHVECMCSRFDSVTVMAGFSGRFPCMIVGRFYYVPVW